MSSFQQYSDLKNQRGLMTPIMTTDIKNVPTRDQSILSLINENTYDPEDVFTQTKKQDRKQLMEVDRPDSYLEEAKNEFVSVSLDASIYQDLEDEAKRKNDNYMNAESSDFVREAQVGNQSYLREQNLLTLPPTGFNSNIQTQELLRQILDAKQTEAGFF